MPTLILYVSYDEQLLKVRLLMLQLNDYEVSAALGFAEAMALGRVRAFDLLVVDHTVPGDEKQEISNIFRAKNTACHVINLHSPGESGFPAAHHNVPFDDSRELLNVISRLVHGSRAAGA